MDDTKLIQFMSVAGVEDLDTAKYFMEAANWDVDSAIDLYFQNPTTTSSMPSRNENLMNTFEEEVQPVREPIPQQASRLYDFGNHQEIDPEYAQFIQRQMQQQQLQQQMLQQRSGTFANTPLKDLYSPPSDLLFQGTFNDAKNTAQDSLKWLLVNIQDDSVFACHELNRDVWRDETMQNIVQCFYVLWQADVNSESGRSFGRLYNVLEHDDFPVIAIIDPRTGELVKRWSGKVNKLNLLDELQKFPDTHSLEEDYMRIHQQPQVSVPVNRNNTQPTATTSTDFGTSSSMMEDEEEMIQAAIRASLEEHSMPRTTEDVDMTDTIPKQEQQQPPRQQTQEQQPQPPIQQVQPTIEKPQFELPDVNLDQFVVAEGGTRIQLVNGSKRNVHRVSLATPLAAVYKLFERELDEKKPFRVTFAGKEIEPSLDKTLESEGMKNASFNLVFDQ